MLFRLDRGGDDATSLPPGWHGGELEPRFPALARATACFWHGRVACGARTLVILSDTQHSMIFAVLEPDLTQQGWKTQ